MTSPPTKLKVVGKGAGFIRRQSLQFPPARGQLGAGAGDARHGIEGGNRPAFPGEDRRLTLPLDLFNHAQKILGGLGHWNGSLAHHEQANSRPAFCKGDLVWGEFRLLGSPLNLNPNLNPDLAPNSNPKFRCGCL